MMVPKGQVNASQNVLWFGNIETISDLGKKSFMERWGQKTDWVGWVVCRRQRDNKHKFKTVKKLDYKKEIVQKLCGNDIGGENFLFKSACLNAEMVRILQSGKSWRHREG